MGAVIAGSNEVMSSTLEIIPEAGQDIEVAGYVFDGFQVKLDKATSAGPVIRIMLSASDPVDPNSKSTLAFQMEADSALELAQAISLRVEMLRRR
jgi:hypothetical protein